MLRFLGLLLGTGLWLVALLLGVVSVMGLLGFAMPDYDRINNFRPLLAFGGLVIVLLASVLWFWPGRFVAAALGFVAILSSALMIIPEYTREHENLASGGEACTFRVLSLAVHSRKEQNRAPVPIDLASALPDYLLTTRADFVALQANAPVNPAVLANLEKKYPFVHSCMGDENCNLALFSKHELSGKHTNMAPNSHSFKVSTPLLYASAIAGSRCQPVTLAVTRLPQTLKPQVRVQQYANLAHEMSRLVQEEQNVVLAGNFNIAPWTVTLQQFPIWSNLSRATYGIFSWPARPITRFALETPPFMPLDHIFLSSGVKVVASSRGRDVGSDHFPIIATLAIAGSVTGSLVAPAEDLAVGNGTFTMEEHFGAVDDQPDATDRVSPFSSL